MPEAILSFVDMVDISQRESLLTVLGRRKEISGRGKYMSELGCTKGHDGICVFDLHRLVISSVVME